MDGGGRERQKKMNLANKRDRRFSYRTSEAQAKSLIREPKWGTGHVKDRYSVLYEMLSLALCIETTFSSVYAK